MSIFILMEKIRVIPNIQWKQICEKGQMGCYDVISMRQKLFFPRMYSLAGLSFKVVDSPGRLSLIEKRRQYEICHLLRGHLGDNQRGRQLSSSNMF